MEDYDSQTKFFTPNGILRGSTAAIKGERHG